MIGSSLLRVKFDKDRVSKICFFEIKLDAFQI
jgi:hypothetical protein